MVKCSLRKMDSIRRIDNIWLVAEAIGDVLDSLSLPSLSLDITPTDREANAEKINVAAWSTGSVTIDLVVGGI